MVLTVEVDGSATAYLLDRIGDAAVNNQGGGRPVVVFSQVNGRAVGAFFREVYGRSLTFDYRRRPRDRKCVGRRGSSN